MIWYSLKCNRMELLPLGRDVDGRKLMKDNDEYAYLYVKGSEGLCVGWLQGNEVCKGQWRKGGSSNRGRGGASVDAIGGVVCGKDGRVVTDQVPS